MLTVLLGTDWVANRDKILQMIAKDVADEKAGRILIVPELISHDTERRLCLTAGDTASRFAEVLSFSRLCCRVTEALEKAPEACLDNGGRVVAMACASRQLHSRLKAYACVETKPEFLIGLVDAVDEFKRCCITADDLRFASQQTSGTLAQKLEELSLLYETYDAICQTGKRDPRDQMSWLLEQLEDSDFAQKHVFYIDGFPDFTRQHSAILEHLILSSPHVVISMNCDAPNSSVTGFEKAGQTIASLIRFAKDNGVAIDMHTLSARKDALSCVREKLFHGSIQPSPCLDEHLFVYSAESVYDAVLASAERIMTLVRSGVRYRDISVVCGDMNVYKNAISMIFSRCHIPVYMSGTEAVLDRSVITTVLSALDAVFGGFEQHDVVRYLKSSLSPLTIEECDRLENYIILWNISANAFTREWTNHPLGLGQTWTQEDYAQLQKLNEYRVRSIAPLEKLSRAFANANNMHQQIQALYEFMEDISLAQRLSELSEELDANADGAGAQILNQIWEILLKALEQMYDVLGNTSWDSETFTRLLRLLLSQYDVGTIPPVLDAVMVGPVSAMRCQQTEHLIVLGADEGMMPSYALSSGVLSDQERDALRKIGVPLTGGAFDGLLVEFSEIYGVFCGAQKTLAVFSCSDQPSFIYKRLAALSGRESLAEAPLGASRADKVEAAAYLSRFGSAKQADALGLNEEYAKINASVKHEIGSVESDQIQKLYGSRLRLSASQIDRYANCRFSYFLKYGLRLKERKEATIDPAEFGTFVHTVLEQTGQKVMELGGFHEVSLEKTLLLAKEFSHEYIKERFSLLDSQRLTYLLQRNADELEMVVQELWQELQASNFAPVGFEVGFGAGEIMNPIEISGKQMDAVIRGYVDRVDSWKDGDKNYFRVVDYKTGVKDFDYCDVFNGLGLQMLLYLFALQEEGQPVLGDYPIGAGIQYFPARVPYISASGMLTEREIADERLKCWKRRGLLLSDRDVLNAMDPTEKQARLCSKITKDGTIGGDVATSAQLQLLKAYIFALLGMMADEIASGIVAPNPYTRGSTHNACTYCPYAAVCHQPSVEGRRNYKTMTAERFWQEVEKEAKKLG